MSNPAGVQFTEQLIEALRRGGTPPGDDALARRLAAFRDVCRTADGSAATAASDGPETHPNRISGALSADRGAGPGTADRPGAVPQPRRPHEAETQRPAPPQRPSHREENQ